MKEKRIGWGKRIISALWGGLLGLITGTALSSALTRIIKEGPVRSVLIEGIDIKIPDFTTSLGFFAFSFTAGIRLTSLSILFFTGAFCILLLVRFKGE